jgi:hypothetical protein
MAHSSYETEIEFRPISQAFSEIKFFLLHFDYTSETCSANSYSHDLKFRFELFNISN